MLGLVLEGGGAKGAFQCGAVKALYDNGYVFDGVAGTSIGAINSAMIAQDCGYKTLYDFWINVSSEDFTEIENIEVNKLINKDFSKETIKYWAKQAANWLLNRGLSADKALILLRGIINEDSVRKSPMDFALATYCITSLKQMELTKDEIPVGELHEFIMASAYHPIFHFQKLNNKYYFDGGIFNNMPINILPEKKNYDRIIAIRTMSKMPYKKAKDSSVKVDFICPSENLGTAINVGKKFLNRKIKLGYYDALRFIKNYKGSFYYINSETDIFSDIFINLSSEEKDTLSNLLKFKKEEFNNVIEDKLRSAINSEANGVSCDGFTLFFEAVAQILNVEKFRIYTQINFLKEISNQINLLNNFEIKKSEIEMQILKVIFPKIKEVLNGQV